MKHLHMLLAVMAVSFFCYQIYTALATDKVYSKIQTKLRTAFAHSIYGLIIITGLIMVKPLLAIDGVPLQWVLAKGILLLAVLSSTAKAFRATTKPAQRKMGILVATLALTGIIILAFIKPENLF